MRYPSSLPTDQRHAARGATVITQETTTSTAWVDLATVGPELTLPAPPAGRVNIHLYAWMRNTTGGLVLASALVTRVSDGAAVFSPTDDYSCAVTETVHSSSMAIIQIAGLDPGARYRYRMQYRVGAGTGEYLRRGIHVVPVIY